jgi:hypothetical protein
MINSIAIALIVFACIFGGSLLGIFFRTVLPEPHLSEKSNNIIKLGMGLIGTLAALVLALLISGAQSSFREQRSELTQMSANILFLDRILADYGPETKEARDLLRSSVVHMLDQMWPADSSKPAQLDPITEARARGGFLYNKIQSLTPHSDSQRSLQTQALSLAFNIVQSRLMILTQQFKSTPRAFVIVLAVQVFWFTTIFFSFGLYAPTNATVIATLFVSALSVAVAIFLLVELSTPFEGLLHLPSDALRIALDHLGE